MSRELKILNEIRSCTVCNKHLPLGPRPIVSFSTQSRIVLIGQAPGIKVHKSGVPWDDASGERLRDWLGVNKEQFYDPNIFALIPMGFCYPGRGKSGDLPPRPECAALWMDKCLKTVKQKQLTLLVGNYSQHQFLGDSRKPTLTETVKNWKEYLPDYIVLPHPSPRNNIWMKKNEWFSKDNLPGLKRRIKKALNA